MKQSLVFIPTLRDIPKDAEIYSHQILLKGGYIKQQVAGVYTYLPIGYRIIKKIENIVREELDKIGCSELLMPALQPKELWLESGRWDEYGKELMRLQDRHERDFCLGPTHEEVITSVVRDLVNSYKKLPVALYQIQTKFRDEFRPRFGLMRGREFIMKDLYSFHANDDDFEKWYQNIRQAYINIFNRLDLNYRIVKADSGAIGGKESEEFVALCDIGEDTIVYSDESDFASNYELHPLEEGASSPDGKGKIKHAKGIEIGHIFKLGTRYSEPMNLLFTDVDGSKKPVIMGCYGIGISRLIMAILEQHHDEYKVKWPNSVAPFDIHVIPLVKEGTEEYNLALEIYQKLLDKGLEVLFDDRKETAGVKFNDADLIGIPFRLVIGKKVKDGIIEIRNQLTGEDNEVNIDDSDSYKFI
ncbi:MAG TPA: proline--tRNA ligase [Acholeplasmataceae bacterium]|jgi:prolyl-tRNA synthetase|nr:proline--tRNA ligase [Acholeplasmataceae bacterium]